MLGHVNGQKHPALCARFDWPVWWGLKRWKRALEYSDPSCQMKGLKLSPCALPLRPGKGGRRPSTQEKLKSRQPGGLTGVFAQDSVPSCAPCAQQTLRGALQRARSSPLWALSSRKNPQEGPLFPRRRPALLLGAQRGALLGRLAEVRQFCVSSSPGSEVPKPSRPARQGHGSWTVPTWLS